MSGPQPFEGKDADGVREMLRGSGYADRAIDYYMEKKNMGSLADADQISELTGHCGDTMKVYLKVADGRIQDMRYQVLGCPGAIASAMAAVELVRGKTLQEARQLRDADIFQEIVDLPDQKQHCIRLSVKALQKAIDDYTAGNGDRMESGASGSRRKGPQEL
jgi:nitrogen fixation NifU-like protein